MKKKYLIIQKTIIIVYIIITLLLGPVALKKFNIYGGSEENIEFTVLLIIWFSIMVLYCINYIIKLIVIKGEKQFGINLSTIMFIIMILTLLTLGLTELYHYNARQNIKVVERKVENKI